MQQAVIVHLKLHDDPFGSSTERELLSILEDEMIEAINDADVGEFDGVEWGGGECVFFMYGPDADRLFIIIEPFLKSSSSPVGGYAIKRYGEPGEAQQVKVTW